MLTDWNGPQATRNVFLGTHSNSVGITVFPKPVNVEAMVAKLLPGRSSVADVIDNLIKKIRKLLQTPPFTLRSGGN